MTEYELSDLILSNSTIMYIEGAAFMTLLSAYIVVVHLGEEVLLSMTHKKSRQQGRRNQHPCLKR
jgi:hypothetical protein